MSTTTGLLSVLIVVACVLCGVGIWAFIESAKTARSIRTLSDDLDARVVPLMDKLDVSVDALNAELLRVDAIVTRFEGVSERVDSTSRTVQEVANAPVELVTDIADRVRRAWRTRRSSHSEEHEPSPPETEAEAPEPPTPTELEQDLPDA